MSAFEQMAGALLRPRLSPVLAAMLTVAALLWALQERLTLEWFAGKPLTAVLAHERDDHGRIMHAVANMTRSGDPRMLLVGGSALREALPPDRLLNGMWRRQHGATVEFVNLSSFDQGMVESLRVLEAVRSRAGLRRRDTLVLGVSPRRFVDGTDEMLAQLHTSVLPFLPLQEVRAQLAVAGLQQWPWPGLWRSRVWLRRFIDGRLSPAFKTHLHALRTLQCARDCLAGLGAADWTKRPRRYLQYAYADMALDATVKARIARSVRARQLPAVQRNLAQSTLLAARIVTLVQAHGAAVVLLDLPRDPASLAAYAPIEADYAEAIGSLRKLGARYVDLCDDFTFGPQDFYDLDHLRPRFRQELATHLVAVLAPDGQRVLPALPHDDGSRDGI